MARQRSAGAAGISSAGERRRCQLLTGAVLALGVLPIVARAAEQEALDEDFLEYLAEFDDKDDDWSWFDADDDDTPVKPQNKPTPSKQTETKTTAPAVEKQKP
jgi:hypothetical protein